MIIVFCPAPLVILFAETTEEPRSRRMEQILIRGSVVCLCVTASAWWIQRRSQARVISDISCLVNKMKEYDLDTRAGIIVCSGSTMKIEYVDPALEAMLGKPKFIAELLPLHFREKHQQLIARYVGRFARPLPDSLNHPLRNVEVVKKDQSTIAAKLIIGRFETALSSLYYVVIQPCNFESLRRSNSFSSLSSFGSLKDLCMNFSASSTTKEEKSVSINKNLKKTDFAAANAKSPEDYAIISRCPSINETVNMAEVYGLAATAYIDRGLVPATERYARATVLYMDIVDFTRHCMAKKLDEISDWMARIHTAVDALLARYAIRKVETRGDCVICVSGTNFTPTVGAESRDLCGDQATRMLAFGHELSMALSAIEGTAARMGMATGPVVLTHIAHGGDALPAKYIYGDTVNVACRMEQTGRVGAVQLAESAARAYAAEREVAAPPLRMVEVKGKGRMRTAMFDCANGTFDLDCTVTPPLSPVRAAIAAASLICAAAMPWPLVATRGDSPGQRRRKLGSRSLSCTDWGV